VIARWKGIVEKPSFGPSKWPQKLKPAKNSKLPKWPENCFEPFGKGGWPPISTWIILAAIGLEIENAVIGLGRRFSADFSIYSSTSILTRLATCIETPAAYTEVY
jgi:hypothetical protein